jgi:hypothetical protein
VRFLLDAKDLIDAVEHERPIALAELDEYLRGRGHELILTSTNVREFAAPLVADGDFLKMRALLQRLEALPVCYMKEGTILYEELPAAWRAYESGSEYEGIDPYVRRWDETVFTREASTRVLVGYRLDEMIYTLWHSRARVLLMPQRHIDWAHAHILKERELTDEDRLSLKEVFIGSVGRQLQVGRRFGIGDVPVERVDQATFGRWIYSNPDRCPGFRLHFHVYHELVANVGDVPKDSDLLDLAHIQPIPYVDAITMDRRMCDYAARVARRLHKEYASTNYAERIYPKLAPLLDAFA